MKYFCPFLAIILAGLIFGSCREQSEIPFPELSETVQPETVPLEFTDPQPLHWDTVQRGAITPTVFPLDLDKMKGMPYDARGFKPLPIAPSEASFDFASLPSKTFDISKAPEQEMKMIMTQLPETFASVKAPLPTRVISSSLDLQSWKFTLVPSTPCYLINDFSGFLWIGTTYGLFRFDGTHLENILPKARIFGMNLDNKGRVWFASNSSSTSYSINMVDPKNRITGYFELPFKFFMNSPIFRHSDGSLWTVGIQNDTSKVLKINPVDLTYQVVDARTGLNENNYYEVFEDGEKNIWASNRNGIDIILKGTKKIVKLGKVNGLSSDTIRAMTRGTDGRIWVAWPNGVDAVDIRKGKITRSREYKERFKNLGRLLNRP